MKQLVYLVGLAVWVSGIVLAKGFWSTLAAVLIPLWGWYLVAEAVLTKLGLV